MADADDRTAAILVVTDRVQSSIAPPLTEDEIAAEVDRAQLATTWAANTEYSIRAIIVLPIRNGHSYECVQPGISSTGAFNFTDWPTRPGSQRAEGSSSPALTWEEIGTDCFNPGVFGQEANVYDINRASRECWLLKARKASQLIDNGDVSLSHMYKHCTEQADRFYPFRRQIQVIRA